MSLDIHPSFELRTRPSMEILYIVENTSENSIYCNSQESIALLKKFYQFHNTPEVENYLNQNTSILDSLLEANIEIKEIFNNNITTLGLELQEDHEEDYEQLFIVIKSSAKPKELVNLLSQLQDQWYLDLSYEIRSKFNIALKSV